MKHDLNRLTLFRGVICAAVIGGLLFSIRLWFPTSRSFPRAPILFAPSEANILLTEWFLSTILVGSLVLTMLSRSPRIFSVLALMSLTLLVCFDQTRLQPWVYQYFLLLGVLALHDCRKADSADSNHALSLLQLIVAGLYFWSGLQKMNFTFIYEILPALLVPLQTVLPWLPSSATAGIFIALTETLIGLGLFFPRTRFLFVWLAVMMHGFVLVLLIANDYNSVVWIWNFTLMFVIIIVFWRSNVYLMRRSLTWRGESWKRNLARSITFASVSLPLLSFGGWWDMYLSGALYSGNTSVAVIRIDGEIRERLPGEASKQMFFVERTGDQMLPLLEWSMADLNVPVYPELRVFKAVTREVCNLEKNKNQVALVIKERPAILDGRYKVIWNNCSQLGP